ncbi:hypothetical protein LSUE1_G001153 [Lachnellula suecica]|uniref:Uncharacterized protein n=1 Tax=Lachnellula suecica TaxID=602035 RepID=A0A8T9CM35_9HELO|nr:hypothetical protein LSUE1_G001153 [Lachnellula suecica]
MAAQSFLTTVPNTPLSNKYANDEDTIGQARLPSGACNFTNLSAGGGGTAPRCGCRRFWDKALGYADGKGPVVKSGFCMCEHHACFHDHEPEGTQRGKSSVDATVVEGTSSLKLPSTSRQAFRIGGSGGDMNENRDRLQESTLPDTLQWSGFIHSGSPGDLPPIPSQCLLPSDNGSGTSGSQSRYYQPFGGQGLGTLSHITKPKAGQPANQETFQPLAENTRALQLYEDHNGNHYMQSLTEVATPRSRLSLSQDRDAPAASGKNVESTKNALEKIVEEDTHLSQRQIIKGSSSQIQVKQRFSNPGIDSTVAADEFDDLSALRLRAIVNQMAGCPAAVQDHDRRLDQLENASFSNGAVDDLSDGLNCQEMRLAELAAKIEELERAQAAHNDASSIGSRHHVASSIDSRVSTTSSAMIAQAMDQMDYSRIEALEAQVAELQASSLPSHRKPWKVEVVFLPYGAELMGVWSSQYGMTQRSRGNSTAPDDWTQTQTNSMAAVQACLTARDPRSAWERSASNLAADDDSAWLMAKACGRQSKVDDRLRSRGLVKVVEINGPDAQDVQAAIMTAFGDLPGTLLEDPFTEHENGGTIPDSLLRYLGLQAPWIPLRKLHKESCLRFLNTSEMITPALWTVPFLTSSVVMRASGLRRLYITQRDSYIQHLGSDTSAWTWQKLRQLPRVYPEQPVNHTPEADAHEPCWEFDERLDPPSQSIQSIHSSFASHISTLSIRSVEPEEGLAQEPDSPSDHFSSAAVSLDASTTPTSIAPQPIRSYSPLRQRNPFRPPHIRTTSMPTMVPIKSSPAMPGKRRIASFENETQSSPSRTPSTSAFNLTLKRRRISRSPSRPRDTPGWSVGPPSPYTFADDIAERNKRGTTPFAYATPHSNAPYIEPRPRSGPDIDIYQDEADEEDLGSATDEFNLEAEESQGWEQNALSDFEPESDDETHQLDAEWEGLQDVDDGVGYESGSAGNIGLRPAADEEEDAHSDAPSEYPSTQQGLFGGPKAVFKIHVDDEVDEAA